MCATNPETRVGCLDAASTVMCDWLCTNLVSIFIIRDFDFLGNLETLPHGKVECSAPQIGTETNDGDSES